MKHRSWGRFSAMFWLEERGKSGEREREREIERERERESHRFDSRSAHEIFQLLIPSAHWKIPQKPPAPLVIEDLPYVLQGEGFWNARKYPAHSFNRQCLFCSGAKFRIHARGLYLAKGKYGCTELRVYPTECGEQLGTDPSKIGSSKSLVLKSFSGEGTLWDSSLPVSLTLWDTPALFTPPTSPPPIYHHVT